MPIRPARYFAGDVMKTRGWLACVVVVLCGGCGGGGGNGSTPSTPSTANISGAWVGIKGATNVTWQLTQTGNTVTGSSLVIDQSNIYVGPNGVRGSITGTIDNNVFTYIDSYTTLAVANCTETDSGRLQITGSSLSGTNTENNS